MLRLSKYYWTAVFLQKQMKTGSSVHLMYTFSHSRGLFLVKDRQEYSSWFKALSEKTHHE